MIGEQLAINAWTGDALQSRSALDAASRNWAATQRAPDLRYQLAAPPLVSPADWRNPEVGWGVVLPENDALSDAERAAGVDAPGPIRQLLAARQPAAVLRYRADSVFTTLRRYYPDRPANDPQISGAATRGIAPGGLPQYLLLCGSPDVLPWELQIVLSGPCFVGRLDLDEAGLANYVNALLSDWSGVAQAASNERVVWATDHGQDDITSLMRQVIAEPILARLTADTQIGPARAHGLFGDKATLAKLQRALIDHQPALVVTASHGMTGPLDDAAAMRAQLGFLVDAERALVKSTLLDSWEPRGCIWYAHACCSAGSASPTRYDGLLPKDSPLDLTLKKIAGVGNVVAPFPKALLSATRPARAFVGHVEPTFNWTLRSPETGQVLTKSLIDAIYNKMHQATPQRVGMALDGWYRHVGDLLKVASAAREKFTDPKVEVRDRARTAATRSELAAMDRGSMVILGDPTVCLPPLQ